MADFMDLTGQHFGDWEAIEYLGKSMWLCKDSNGNTKKIHGYSLRTKYSGIQPKGEMPEGFLHKKFNSWYVEEYIGGGFWKCRCDCGNISKVNGQSLKNNKSVCCKECSNKKKLAEDLTGKDFGLWHVQYYAGDMRWHCVCGCEAHTERDVLGRDLRNGHATSCGCDRNYHIIHKDISGQTFNYLQVIEYTGKDQMWRCKCLACGREDVIIFRDSIVSGKTKSCGCLKEKLRSQTLFDKYGDTNTVRINNPRDPWQIKVASSKENLMKFINSLDHTPSVWELADTLNINDTSVTKMLKKFGLEYIINDWAGVSDIEKSLVDYVKSIYKGDIVTSDRKILDGKELDIYIPEKEIAIEFDGDYWHSDIYKDKYYHQRKTIDCIRKKVHLIHVFEYEWVDKESREKVQEYLKHCLCESNKIGARETTVKEVNTDEAKQFLEKYHLQGYSTSKINIGCYYNEELIGIMTFGSPRFNNDFEYELIRLCWKSDVNVLGGTEKMLNYFVKGYNPKSIVSYCDLSKFSGNIYFKLNFQTSANNLTSPNYVWVNKRRDIVLKRYQTQKQKLIDEGLGKYGNTEDEIMSNLNYLKIYNSGNLRFEWYNDTN